VLFLKRIVSKRFFRKTLKKYRERVACSRIPNLWFLYLRWLKLSVLRQKFFNLSKIVTAKEILIHKYFSTRRQSGMPAANSILTDIKLLGSWKTFLDPNFGKCNFMQRFRFGEQGLFTPNLNVLQNFYSKTSVISPTSISSAFATTLFRSPSC